MSKEREKVEQAKKSFNHMLDNKKSPFSELCSH